MSTQFDVDMYKNDQVTRRYSEGFKLKILAELSTGKYSKRQLCLIYGLRASTINGWIKKYDRKELMNTRIMVENQDEISRVKAYVTTIYISFSYDMFLCAGFRSEHQLSDFREYPFRVRGVCREQFYSGPA